MIYWAFSTVLFSEDWPASGLMPRRIAKGGRLTYRHFCDHGRLSLDRTYQ
jgi:hypothetical protein